MKSTTTQSFARALFQGLVALALLATSAANVSSALAATPPTNDNFVNAKKITTASTSASLADMTGATTEASDPALTCDGFSQGEASMWYTYTPVTSGEITLNTTNSGYDTVITVFMAENPSDPSTLVEVGCNDDATYATKTSLLTMAVRGAVKYYFEITRKSGSAVTPPDAFRFGFSFVSKPVMLPPLKYDGTDDEIIYSPVGWTLIPILPGQTYKGNIHVGNNPGDSATVFFDGSGLQFCYVTGPDMGTLDVYIDNVLVGSLGQGSGVYQYTCWDTPPLPIAGSASIAADNVHKMRLVHAGPAGKKVNIDSFEIYYHFDFIPPGPITTLAATTGSTAGKVNLTWIATGDDNYIGRVYGNQIRYSLSPITTQAEWDAATPYVINLPNLLTAGNKQTVSVAGLVPNLTYYFNVRGVDEVGNMGDLSNSVSAIAKGGTAVGVGTYDDKSPYWMYTGTWVIVGSPDNIGDAIHVANQLGSTASIYFTGTQFRLYYNAAFDMGLMDVYLDGAYLTTIDEYSFVTQRMTYVSPMLTNGPHSVQLVQKSLPYINIDAIAVFNIVDGGPPDPIWDLAASTGLNLGTVDLFWTAQGDDPGGVGKAYKYEVRYSLLPILTEADWNAAKTATGMIPAPQTAGNLETMTVTGLTPGVTYYFTIRASDDAGYTNLSNSASAMASMGSYTYMLAGWYEDNDPAWYYTGIWSIGSYFQASGGQQHNTTLSGSSATFFFNGTGFTLYFQKKNGLGSLKVYIDGIQVGTIGQQNNLIQWQQSWSKPGLSLANHVVQFVAAGSATLDAIEIIP